VALFTTTVDIANTTRTEFRVLLTTADIVAVVPAANAFGVLTGAGLHLKAMAVTQGSR
jgi:hypothetical protein